jgi:UDP-GlcNAc:undecaprenyl-phosphate/decaprenyl-phosphate GlcNAc-1-phosphate transferase
MIDSILAAAIAFSVTVLAIVALRPVAVAIDLVDRPGGRKTHHGEVPIVGGLAMFLGIIVGLGIAGLQLSGTSVFVGACGLLVVIGMLDDRFDLSPWARIAAQSASGFAVIKGSAVLISSLGGLLGGPDVTVSGPAAVIVTLFALVGVVNAFNMLDGMDGLAGTMALVACGGLAYLSLQAGLLAPAMICGVIASSVVAFLLFNLPVSLNRGVRCFMGDDGSTLLGFSLGVMAIYVSQNSVGHFSPVTVLWVIAMPIYELCWTTLRRLIRGQSPFKADAEHFHHVMIAAGFSVRGAFMVYVAFATLIAVCGVLLSQAGIADSISLAMFVIVGGSVVYSLYHSKVMLRVLPVSAQRAQARTMSPDR